MAAGYTLHRSHRSNDLARKVGGIRAGHSVYLSDVGYIRLAASETSLKAMLDTK